VSSSFGQLSPYFSKCEFAEDNDIFKKGNQYYIDFLAKKAAGAIYSKIYTLQA